MIRLAKVCCVGALVASVACELPNPNSMNAAVSPREATTVSSNSGEIFAGRLAHGAPEGPAAAAGKPTSGIVVGRATLAGGGSAEPIERAIEEKRLELESCYADARRARPNLEGTLALEFSIGNDGSLQELQTISSDELPFTLASCALTQIRKVRAQVQSGSVAPVLYTLKFQLVKIVAE